MKFDQVLGLDEVLNLESGLTQNLSKPWDSRPSGGREI